MSDQFDYDVFISHSSKDKPVVRELANRLKKDGLRVWLDEWEIQPGDMIGLKIQQGLERSRTLLMVMSQAYFASEWSTLEHHTLLFRDPTNAQRRFIPLLIENCTLPDVIAQFAYIDWRQKSDEAYERLLSACRSSEESIELPVVLKKHKEQSVLDQALMIFKGHTGIVHSVAVTSDGKKVVSGSQDTTLKVWNLESGRCLLSVKGHHYNVFDVAITPDGKRLVSGSSDTRLSVWDIESGTCLSTFGNYPHSIRSIAITPDGKKVVSGSNDNTLRAWDLASGRCLMTMQGHTRGISVVAITPDGKRVVSGSLDGTIRVWDLASSQCLATLVGHNGLVFGVAITPDGKRVVSGSKDATVKVWDMESRHCLATFEGHASSVLTLAVTSDGKKVVSGSKDHTLKLWDIESGACLATLEGHTGIVNRIAITPDRKRVISGSDDNTVRVWELPDFSVPSQTAKYTNAKVVLVGESGVGKTGLAIRLVEDRWEVTDSTHGMHVWQVALPPFNSAIARSKTAKQSPKQKRLHGPVRDDIETEREVWLWDFAGQPDYRLIHQLYMDETALALIVIDPQRDNPFESLGHWEKALSVAVKHDPAKLLIAGRCDRGGVTISRTKLAQYCQMHGYSEFLNTSAKTGAGLTELKAAIAKHIPWERLPWTATSRLFKTLKDAILRLKQEDIVLIRISELRQRLQFELRDEAIEEKALRAVVGLLAGQGLIRMLDFGDFVLLQPEQINNYASAVVRCARDNAEDIGCVSEREVLEAQIAFPPDMKRLNEADEKILLRAMVETFVNRSLCIREETPAGTQLVFPSYFK